MDQKEEELLQDVIKSGANNIKSNKLATTFSLCISNTQKLV